MFARRLNELRLTIELRPAELLLVKEGRHREGDDKTRRVYHRDDHVVRNPPRPRLRDSRGYGDYDTDDGCFNMAFVFSHTASGEGRFYLPGSSLRGVLRSAAERVVGRWRPDLLSDPFLREGEWQHPLAGSDLFLRKNRNDRVDGPTYYRHALPIERCFGHTALRGRWTISDALMCATEGAQLPNEPEQFRRGQARMEVRDSVGIDRHTGAARNQVKYQFEALSGGVFVTTLTLVNYERWQPGLLAHALAAIDGGSVRIGYGTRRGLGRVRLAVKAMRWRWYGAAPRREGALTALPALGDLAARAGIDDDYGWQEPQADGTALALDVHPGLFGWEASITPQAAARDSAEATSWPAAPWPALASALPPALIGWWKREEVLRDR